MTTKRQKYIDEIKKSSSPEPTKLGTKHPWVKMIQIYSNDGPRPIQRGDDIEIVKIR